MALQRNSLVKLDAEVEVNSGTDQSAVAQIANSGSRARGLPEYDRVGSNRLGIPKSGEL